MLSKQDNELICQVGPDTPMGKAMRRYWTPVCQSSDLPEPGGDPQRFTILGQNFVAFRGDDGAIGFLNDNCCHRGVSLSLGRVEGCSLRCIFHGWRFARDGEVLETPNVPNPDFKTRIRHGAYPVREAGGVVWAYLGPKELEPPFPHYPWFDLEPKNRINAYQVEGANYLQIMEALFDSTHLNFLHRDGLNKTPDIDSAYAADSAQLLVNDAATTEAEATDFGFHYASIREAGDGRLARITAFVAPYTMLQCSGGLWMCVVPINDERSIYFYAFWEHDRDIGLDPHREEHLKFLGLDDEALRRSGMTYDTIDDPNAPTFRNRFHQNRAAMAAGATFSGFHSFTQEDAAVIMSAGAIRDRTIEHLCEADRGIGMHYRTLKEMARAGERGEDPVGLNADAMQIFAKTVMLKTGEKWQDHVPPHRKRVAKRAEAGVLAAG